MAKVISLINNKGGVGKTTSAVNLAAGVAKSWRRVLLVDLDNQGSASLSFGLSRKELSPCSAQVMLEQVPIEEAIRPTDIEWLDLITGSLELAHTDLRLSQIRGRENRLRKILRSVEDEYDYIFIDCPPSMSLLSVNALVASDAYIVPVMPEYLAMEGLANLEDVIDQLRKGMNARMELLGIVLTMVDYRKKATREIVGAMREHFGKAVFDTEIRVNVRLSEAPSFGQSIYDYDDDCTGAENYRLFTGEVVKRCRELVRHTELISNGTEACAEAG